MYPKPFCYARFGSGFVCLLLASSAFAQLKTLDRNLEPVVISGNVFPEFVGAAVSAGANELFLYAYRADSKLWEQIPFQFDEKNSADKYFNPNVDEIAGLDDNDELVFMAKDAGDRGLSSWIDDAESRGFVRYEIKITDPLDPNKAAWVYLYRSRTLSFSPNLTDYVQYFESTTSNIAEDSVATNFYSIRNSSHGFPNSLRIPTLAGGNGENLIDVLKFRAKTKISIFGGPTITENRINFVSGDLINFKDGHIRIIREIKAHLDADVSNLSFTTPPAYYYPYSFQLQIDIPSVSPASITEGRISVDHSVKAVGMKFASAKNSLLKGFTVDGLANEVGLIDSVDSLLPNGNWTYVNGPQGTLVHFFPLEKVGKTRRLFYRDNSSQKESDDTGDNKSYGDVGIFFKDDIKPPFALRYKGYFLSSSYTSEIGNQLALYEQNTLQLDFAPQDFGSVPVELVAFNATVDDQNVLLEWLTATETNNFGFDVERRRFDRDDWQKLAFVAGNGTTTEPSRYEFVDRNLQSGTYDYRLKQIDTDGAFEYSNIITATVGLPATFMLAQNFPNPFNPVTEIQYQLPAADHRSDQRTVLKVYNILGKEVRTLVNEEQPLGFYRVSWDGTDNLGQRVSSGIYIYRLQTGSFTATRKMALVQ